MTDSQRRSLFQAPKNKVSQLYALEAHWNPWRPKATFAQILSDHKAAVVNTGPTLSGHLIEDELNEQVSAMMMFALRNAIMRHCAGWDEQGRHVTIFSDELSLLAGSSSEIIEWLRDKGRSFGVLAVLATQRPEQLAPSLRQALLDFGTVMSFTQSNVNTAGELATNAFAGSGDWTADDLLHLEPFTAIVRTDVDRRRQSACAVALENYEADRPGFAALQGYPPLTPRAGS